MKFIGIIPARYASTRFPGKPLVDIGGKTMIQRVYEQASKVLDIVYVATDDQRIFDHVISIGAKVCMTAETHQSGTDRCAEAIATIKHEMNLEYSANSLVIINIQGDEPFIQPEQLQEIKKCFADENTELATLIKPIVNQEDVFNPNLPKVIVNEQDEAIYFSRSPIPYLRNVPQSEWHLKHQYYKHIGIYAYRYDILKHITKLSQSSLEIAESLEQLRWIENGCKIKTAVTDFESIAVDTPEDLEKIKNTFLL